MHDDLQDPLPSDRLETRLRSHLHDEAASFRTPHDLPTAASVRRSAHERIAARHHRRVAGMSLSGVAAAALVVGLVVNAQAPQPVQTTDLAGPSPLAGVATGSSTGSATGAMKGWRSSGGEAAPQSDPPRMAVKWGCMHWMPRNNMFAHRYPEPIAQGRAPWAWTGYWNWDDGLTPRSARWSNYTGRTSDLDWSLNQVRWAAQTGIRPGKVTLRLGTVTPDLDTFLARIDGGDWLPVGPSFPWTLHEGTNRIDLRTRNRAGVLGVISHIELDYAVKKD